MVALSFGVVAEEISETSEKKQRELGQVRQQIKVIQKSLGILETEKNSLTSQLRLLESRYGKLSTAIRKLNRQAAKQKEQLKAVRKDRDRQEAEVKQQGKELERQIVSAYAMGKDEKLKLILNSEDPARNSRLLVYYDYLNRARLQKLQSIQEGLTKLHLVEVKLAKEQERLDELIDRKKREQARLGETRKERKTVLASLRREQGSQEARLKQLQADESKLQRLIASLREAMERFPAVEGDGKPFADLKGKLGWPVKGKIRKKFGSRREGGRWNGVLVSAKEGVDVRAVSGGRIAYADWLRGYGLLTIIDHGDGYMSLYAFNQSLFKEVGDWVSAGERIASVGYSGGRTEAGLYFEIRKKGKPVNPIKWCKKARKGKVG